MRTVAIRPRVRTWNASVVTRSGRPHEFLVETVGTGQEDAVEIARRAAVRQYGAGARVTMVLEALPGTTWKPEPEGMRLTTEQLRQARERGVELTRCNEFQPGAVHVKEGQLVLFFVPRLRGRAIGAAALLNMLPAPRAPAGATACYAMPTAVDEAALNKLFEE